MMREEDHPGAPQVRKLPVTRELLRGTPSAARCGTAGMPKMRAAKATWFFYRR
jgi:hypothetical protein